PGVVDASVNLMTGTATIAYDPAAVTPDSLVETVRATGYGAELPVPGRTASEDQAAHDAALDTEYRGLRARALFTLVAAGVSMVLSMPLMVRQSHGVDPDPFMEFAMRHLSGPLESAFPWLYALPHNVIAGALLALTAAVVLGTGRHFYTRAWAAFRRRSADMNTLI